MSKPSEENKKEYLDHGLSSVHPDEKLGAWILYYDKDKINEAWEKAKGTYNMLGFMGIDYMLVTTAKENNQLNDTDLKAILFFCGPSDNDGRMRMHGMNVIEQTKWTNKNCCSGKGSENVFFITLQNTKIDGGLNMDQVEQNALYKLQGYSE